MVWDRGEPCRWGCGTIHIKVNDKVLTEETFKTLGCAAAIATSSMVTEMAKGMTLEQALKISRQDVAEVLDGLPPGKMECSNLGADALHKAINEYLIKTGQSAITTSSELV